MSAAYYLIILYHRNEASVMQRPHRSNIIKRVAYGHLNAGRLAAFGVILAALAAPAAVAEAGGVAAF